MNTSPPLFLRNLFARIAFSFIVLAVSGTGFVSLAADPHEAMARQMGKHTDQIWDQKPEDGKANIRFLFLKGGEPFAGKLSIETDFHFRAQRHGGQSGQGANPNQNGRWMYEGLEPGTYNLTMSGVGDFEGWSWTKETIEVAAGESPLFEINLDE